MSGAGKVRTYNLTIHSPCKISVQLFSVSSIALGTDLPATKCNTPSINTEHHTNTAEPAISVLPVIHTRWHPNMEGATKRHDQENIANWGLHGSEGQSLGPD